MRADCAARKCCNENGSDGGGPWYRKEERAKQHDATEHWREIGRKTHLGLRVREQLWSEYAHGSID
jgi:hypothetical protein